MGRNTCLSSVNFQINKRKDTFERQKHVIQERKQQHAHSLNISVAYTISVRFHTTTKRIIINSTIFLILPRNGIYYFACQYNYHVKA